MNKINKKKIVIILALLFISTGFAFLSANLDIKGIANIKKVKWNIYFDNVVTKEGGVFEITAPTTTGTNTTELNFQVALEDPGDSYSFLVDVVNDGTIDAMFNLKTDNTTLTTAQQKLFDYQITYYDGNPIEKYNLLKKGHRDTLKVTLTYKRDIELADIPSADNEINMSILLEYRQAKNATARKPILIVNRQNSGELSVGDEVSIGDEHFYVFSTNNNTTKLFAKYNLNVGSNTMPGEVGIQNELAIAWTQEETYYSGRIGPGAVHYSNIKYWVENDSLKTKYGTSYPAEIYDEEYNAESGNYYSILYYTDQYANYLRNLLGKTVEVRPLTLTEINNFGCTSTCMYVSSEKQFIRTTTYWITSAYSNTNIHGVTYGGNVGNWAIDNGGLGVRPLVIVDTSDIS